MRKILAVLLLIPVLGVAGFALFLQWLKPEAIEIQRERVAAESLQSLYTLQRFEVPDLIFATIPTQILRELVALGEGAVYRDEDSEITVGKVSLTAHWGALEIDADASLRARGVEFPLRAKGHLVAANSGNGEEISLRVQLAELKLSRLGSPAWVRDYLPDLNFLNTDLPAIPLPVGREFSLPLCPAAEIPVPIPTEDGELNGILSLPKLPELQRKMVMRSLVVTPDGILIAAQPIHPDEVLPAAEMAGTSLTPISSQQFETVWNETLTRLNLPGFRPTESNRLFVFLGENLLCELVDHINALPAAERRVRFQGEKAQGNLVSRESPLKWRLFVKEPASVKGSGHISSLAIDLEPHRATLKGIFSASAEGKVHGSASWRGMTMNLSDDIRTPTITEAVTLSLTYDPMGNDFVLTLLEPREVHIAFKLDSIPLWLEGRGFKLETTAPLPVNEPLAQFAIPEIVPREMELPTAVVGPVSLPGIPRLETQQPNVAFESDRLVFSSGLRITLKPAALTSTAR